MSTGTGPAASSPAASTIRPAAPADAQAISELIQRLARFFTLRPDGEGAEAFLETIRPAAIREYLESGEYHFLVAEVGDGAEARLAGVVAVRGTCHLFHLFVSPDFHRQGIASRLWQRAKQAAIRAGNSRGEFSVFSTPYAVPVYESFGFRAT
ncbi:MAG: GNAT family N-acetyltransferase, partial [Holophagales bacterium]|nr:GNAT family N-acetyltransferase [Holophagales bacterium]